MAEHVFPVSYTIRQMLSGHSLAADIITRGYYANGGVDGRGFFVDAFAGLVQAGRAGDAARLSRDALICHGPERLRAYDVDLTNGQFMGAARFAEPFKWGYEPDILALLAQFLPADGVFFDVGSNWGYFTWHLLLDPMFSGSVVAFEPSRRSFADLARLGALGGFEDRLRTLNIGVGEQSAVATLSLNTWSGNQSIAHPADFGELTRVERLDALDLPAPSMIKLDVEDFEAQAIRGASGLIERSMPLIVFENWLREPLDQMVAPFTVLSEAGYVFFSPVFKPLSEFSLSFPAKIEGSLLLSRFAPEDRQGFGERINVFACPSSRLETIMACVPTPG